MFQIVYYKYFSIYLEINECTVNPDICGQGHCINLPVGYTCLCYDGYRLNDQQTKCSGNPHSLLPVVNMMHGRRSWKNTTIHFCVVTIANKNGSSL